jgi:hypothetical protein
VEVDDEGREKVRKAAEGKLIVNWWRMFEILSACSV